MVRQNDGLCPCESGQIYDKCCGLFLAGMGFAPTAEALMRSRYTAYVEENAVYMIPTWHPDQPTFEHLLDRWHDIAHSVFPN